MDGYIYRICLTPITPGAQRAQYWTCVDYDALPERPDDGRTPEEAFLLGEDLQKLRREVMRLCRLRREAIVLFYYEHKSSREIAARLGVPEARCAGFGRGQTSIEGANGHERHGF